ncbi:hypothetical protein [Halocella sp. SP3-1]|uniref:hypothetical protein n=1 Tax=Halocella sp. SP3-1 TaxID=2382161 RepID=UPI000F7623F8|nr:hypothetical protein [Halocella sp. SP3-1]AZO96116.1 hypothetical protein D7D81_16800 [Halocella sp. SP3-1]
MKIIKSLQTQTKKGTKIELSVDEYRNLRISIEGLLKNKEISRDFGIKEDKIDCGIVEDEQGKFRAIIPINEEMAEFIEWFENEKREWREALVEVFVPGDGGMKFDSRKSIEEILEEKTGYIEYLNTKFKDGKSHLERALRKHLEWAEEEKQEKEERKQRFDAHFKKCLEKAKRTGQNVQFDRYTEACNDASEEYDLDIIAAYVKPNGEIFEKRSHTY